MAGVGGDRERGRQASAIMQGKAAQKRERVWTHGDGSHLLEKAAENSIWVFNLKVERGQELAGRGLREEKRWKERGFRDREWRGQRHE